MSDNSTSDTTDEMKEGVIDAFVYAIAATPLDYAPLTDDQISLLDRWIEEHATQEDCELARQLVRANFAAKEFVLDQQLIAAASNEAGPSDTLSAKILSTINSSVIEPQFERSGSFWGGWGIPAFGGLSAAVACLAFFMTMNEVPKITTQTNLNTGGEIIARAPQPDQPAAPKTDTPHMYIELAHLDRRELLDEKGEHKKHKLKEANPHVMKEIVIDDDMLARGLNIANKQSDHSIPETDDGANIHKNLDELTGANEGENVEIIVDDAIARAIRKKHRHNIRAIVYDLATIENHDLKEIISKNNTKRHLYLITTK